MRYADEAPPSPSSQSEFILRTRYPTPVQVLALFGVAFMAICLAYQTSRSFFQFSLLVLPVLGLVVGILAYYLQRTHDHLLIAEFQNRLYSAALCTDDSLCLILRRDGTIVYTHRNIQTLYPQYQRTVHHTLDDILRMAGVEEKEAEQVCRTMGENRPVRRPVVVKDLQGTTHRTMLSIDPVPQVEGYYLLRGRPYVEPRNA